MNYFKNLLKMIASWFGAVLISRVTYEQVLHQRKSLFESVLSQGNFNFKPGAVCFVFSKDRPIQLFALLESYLNYVSNPIPLIVIYNAKNKLQEKAYLEVINFFEGSRLKIDFVKEKNFKLTFLNKLLKVKVDKILFLVDDLIFIDNVDFDIFKKIDPKLHVLSLRHSPFIKKSFTTKTRFSVPTFEHSKFSDDLLEFNWFESVAEWSDPWSVDGQLLDTSEVFTISLCSNFKAPNSYEISLKAFNDLKRDRKDCASEGAKS